MTSGSVAATALVAVWSRVHTLAQLYAVLIGVGAAAAMVLYEPAFAVVVSWFDPARRGRAVLAVIVVAGSPAPSSCRSPASSSTGTAGAPPCCSSP